MARNGLRTFGAIFLTGSIVTLGLAALLLVYHHPVAAGAVILISPFPCPPGVPC